MWKWLVGAILLTLAGIAGLGCSSDDALPTETEAQLTTEEFFRDFFRLLTGEESIETLLSYYPPECSHTFTEEEIAKASDSAGALRTFFPGLRSIEIDYVSLVEPRFVETSDGVRVFASDVVVGANGMPPRSLEEIFAEVDMVEAEEGGSSIVESDGLLVIKQSGRFYVDVDYCIADPFESF